MDEPDADLETCFLCRPDESLVFDRSQEGVALCGLGPIVNGYTVVGTSVHVKSAADAVTAGMDGFLEFAESVRAFLTHRYGSCLMTEHGRVPVCTSVRRAHEAHCFHSHFLLFPGCGDVTADALAYCELVTSASNLKEALRCADQLPEYFMVSPSPGTCCVLRGRGLVPRQFARYLVASNLGLPELADWRLEPNYSVASDTASVFRRQILEAQR